MTSTHAPQYERLRALHSKIRQSKGTFQSLINSFPSIDNSTEFHAKRKELRVIHMQMKSTVDEYVQTVDKLRRRIDSMVVDTAEKQGEQKKEDALFNEMREEEEDGVEFNEVSLRAMVSSLYENMNRVINDTGNDISSSETMAKTSISFPPSISQPLNQSIPMTSDGHPTQSNLPLPIISLSQFNGESTHWDSFHSQYMDIIDSKSYLSDHEKLYHLRSGLTGSALRTVAAIPVTGENLQPTIDRLKAAYGKRSNSILLNQLLSIKPKSQSLEHQLECTEDMINKVIPLKDKSVVDNFHTINQIAVTIHFNYLEKIHRLEPSTIMEALTHIENDLRERIQLEQIKSTYRSSNSAGQQPNFKQHNSHPVHDKSINRSFSKPFIPKQTHNSPLCVYCGKHAFSDCTTITSTSERKSILREKRLCFKCLSSQHKFNQCDRKCQTCSKNHHRSICDTPSSHSNVTATVTANQPINGMARLSIATAAIQNPISNCTAVKHILLDSGAMTSIISRSLSNELNLIPHSSQSMTLTGVGGESTGGENYDVVSVNILTTNGAQSINAIVMDTVITRSMEYQPLSDEDCAVVQTHCGIVPHLTGSSIVTPDLLISISQSISILTQSEEINLPSGYKLIKSSLGPMIVGQSNTTRFHQKHNVLTSLVIDAPLEKQIERFFSVDESVKEYGITEADARLELNQKVEQHFTDTAEKIKDQFQVQYYLKPDIANLPTNEGLAHSRLNSTVHSLSKKEGHLLFYDSIIKDQLSAGMIEVAESVIPSDHPCHYLAHQAVLRPDKPTTPLRIVYDASAKLKGKPCLNDVIAQGPCTLEHIASLLIRARSRKTLIVADVEKAFLQVRVHPSQRDLLRFLWIKDIHKPVSKDNLITYRFTVTPFGVNQSPYLLSKVIETHLREASNCGNHDLINQLINNVYVDNVIINCDLPTQEMYTDSKSLFQNMHMNLRDFASNSIPFIQSVADSDRAPVGNQKLLGIVWNPANDDLSIKIPSLIRHTTETKRTMLSTIASIYDPLGLLHPLVLQAKSLVQKLWCQDLKWDQPVDSIIQSQFHDLLSEIESFKLSIPRYTGMSSLNEIHLVAFADASKLAMGAIIYVWTPEKTTLLMSKSRLAPAKTKATIPKLELNALVIAHSLLKYVVDSVRKEFPATLIHTHVYSDSAIALFWYLNDPNKKNNGSFVANRVKSIREMTQALSSITNVQYHPAKYVKTDSNPADHITRGLSSTDMNNDTHMWWKGAPWMKNPPEKWPNDPIPPTADPPYTRLIAVLPSPLIDLERVSTLRKAVKITGFLLRFIQRSLINSSNITLKEKYNQFPITTTLVLTSIERTRALQILIQNHQSCHIHIHDDLIKNGGISKDEYGIFRKNSRLDLAEMPSQTRFPILIPTSKDSKLARLIISNTHVTMFHAGIENVLNQLKQEYWIPRSRQLVKSQVRSCIPCRKTNNLPYAYTPTPPFPSDRVTISKPFQSTGIDFIGPFTSTENVKMYAIIVTCLSSRLSHIEVTNSMFPSAFINAFRRFTSRRGTPITVLSDQATTLKLSSTLLSGFDSEEALNTLFQPECVQWKFTTSHAPWKGAVYERLIRIFKNCLTRSIGKRKLSFDDFSTITAEIEAVLNTRPLTYVASDEIRSFSNPVLRPIDLIMPNSNFATQIQAGNNDNDTDYHPPGEESMSRTTAIRQLRKSIQLTEAFWSKWHSEYLTTIRDSKNDPNPLHNYRSSSISPKPGAIVLIIDESGNTPRSSWYMGKIISLSGSEATVKSSTTGRIIQRPINLLIPLELDSIEDTPESNPMSAQSIDCGIRTRSKSKASQR